MESREFNELAARCEAVSRVVLLLATELEGSGVMNGHRFQESVLNALPHGSASLDRAAALMQQLMANYSNARSLRRAQALWSANLPSHSE